MTDNPTEPLDTSSTEPGLRPKATQRTIWIVAILAVIALLAIGSVAIALSVSLGARPVASPSPSASPTESSSATPTPSETPIPTGTSTETPSPTRTPGPVKIDKPAVIVPGVTAEITSIEAVQGEASGPGEIAAPAIRFVVTVSNTTDAPANLANTVITTYYGPDEIPANELRKPGGSPLPASVGAGKFVTGTYIFSVPKDERDQVRIVVDYSVKVKPLVFEGSVPK